MSDAQLVDKREALQLVNKHINRLGLIDFATFIELLILHNKLTLWILQEAKSPQRRKLKAVEKELAYLQTGLNKLNGRSR